jgi:hypothetical protein
VGRQEAAVDRPGDRLLVLFVLTLTPTAPHSPDDT